MNVALLVEKLGWHFEAWLQALSKRSDVDKVFLSDPSRYNLDMVRRYLGDKLVAVYDSPQALFQENEVEITIVDTAPFRTPDMVQASLEAGVSVIVEKPAATSPEAYAPLVELADSKGLLLAISLMETPAVREAIKIVAEGQLGRIYNIQCLISDHQRWRIRDQMDWVFSKEKTGGGMLGHEFCHILNYMPRIVGSDVTHVTGFAKVVSGEPLELEDSVAISVLFANGAMGTLNGGSWGPSVMNGPEYSKEMYSFLRYGFSVWGEKGAIHVDMEGGLGGNIIKDLQYEGPVQPIPTTRLTHRTNHQLLVQRWEAKLPPADRMGVMIQESLDYIRGNGPPPIANDAGLKMLKFQHAVYKASETGETQQLL